MKKNIYIMYVIALLQGMVFYGPIATLYRQAVGISIFQITLIESISLVIMISLEIPLGHIADRIGYRRTMIGCCCLYFISKIVFWKADSFGDFLFERILLGIVLAGLSGVDVSILYLSCTHGDSQRVFGIYNNLCQIGLLLAAGIYAVFIGDNYRTAGLLTVVSYGISACLAFGLKEVTKEKSNGISMKVSLGILKQVFSNKRLILVVLSVALLNETHQTITVFLNQLKYIKVGMSPSMISIVYIIITISGLLGGFSSKITDKIGDKNLGLLVFFSGSIACILLAFTKYAIIAVLGVLILRIGFSILQPLQMKIQNEEITTRDRATALSMNAVIMDIIAIFTNVVFGKIAAVNLQASMVFGFILCIVGFVLYHYSWQAFNYNK
ncbi:MFS transporter [Alloiococcus sp. CFN-8]|uniref:MFS transporter n=1 Tax=Alloiococcus sp. CFN-8 TaxID=3416081 RepID=UPI003CEC086B